MRPGMKKRLIVPIETAARELDARLYLSLKLLNSKLGEWEVIFGHHKRCGKYMNVTRGPTLGFVYLSSGMTNNLSGFKKILSDGGKYCLMDEEGGVFSIQEQRTRPRGGRDHKGIKYIDRIFFWGEHERNNWYRRHRLLEERQAVVSGNPRFDISKKCFSGYFERTGQLDKDREPYILVIFAFGTGNSLIDVKLEANYWESIGEGSKLEMWLKEREYQQKSFKLYLDGIRRLIEANEDQQFVIRPHPVEDLEVYHDAFVRFPNVEINNSGPVQEWLPKSKLFIHNGCTTAIEAAVNGFRPICFAPFIDRDMIQTLTFDISDVVETIDDLKSTLRERVSTKDSADDSNIAISNLKEYVHNVDLDATDIIIDHLNQINFNRSVALRIKPESFMQHLRDFVPRALKIRLRRVLGSYESKGVKLTDAESDKVAKLLLKRQRIKCPGINLAVLEEKQKELYRLGFVEKMVNIKKLEEDLFLLD